MFTAVIASCLPLSHFPFGCLSMSSLLASQATWRETKAQRVGQKKSMLRCLIDRGCGQEIFQPIQRFLPRPLSMCIKESSRAAVKADFLKRTKLLLLTLISFWILYSLVWNSCPFCFPTSIICCSVFHRTFPESLLLTGGILSPLQASTALVMLC